VPFPRAVSVSACVIREQGPDVAKEACGAGVALGLDVELGIDFEHAVKSTSAAVVRNRVMTVKVLCRTSGRSRDAGVDMFIDRSK
jgi:hypothetical protein